MTLEMRHSAVPTRSRHVLAAAATLAFAVLLALPLGAAAAAGSWTIDSSPNPSADRNAFLNDVTCVSATDCWAVGNYINESRTTQQTLIEQDAGSGWAVVSSPNTIAFNDLKSVTCVSATDCWAVGIRANGGAIQTLIEHYTASGWTIVSSPDPSTSQNAYLTSVTCASATDCWAVGYYYNSTGNGADQTLIEQNTGSGWTIVSSPSTSLVQTNFLYGVTCVGAADCWAVGDYNDGVGYYQTLVEQNTGSGWAIVSSPSTSPAQANYLVGVACASAADCWAVGYNYSSSTGANIQTLIEQNTGSGWTIVSSPNASVNQNSYLSGVTCVSAADCWAVGYYLNSSTGADQTLTEQETGNDWAIVSSPDASVRQNNALNSVTCVTASDCRAVGDYVNAASYAAQTLIEQYAVTPPPNVPDLPWPPLALLAALVGGGMVRDRHRWYAGRTQRRPRDAPHLGQHFSIEGSGVGRRER